MTTLQSEDCQNNDPNDSFPMAIESLRLRFPLDNSMRIVFTGYYNGYNVEIRSVEEIALLYHMGCFGKGSASRSQPKIAENDNSPRIMRKRQFLKRNYWFKKFCSSIRTGADTFMKDVDDITDKILSDSEKRSKKDVIDLVSSDEEFGGQSYINDNGACTDQFHCPVKEDIVVIVPNSDSEEENYFANMKPKCCLNKIKIQEKLMLTLQEAFFLLYGLGCLQIVNLDNTLLNIEQSWDLFIQTDRNFVLKYVVYHYYRSKGYIVKPGIKFGGDYLLYREGPAVTHADYIVVIKSPEKSFHWTTLLGHVRMAKTTVKINLIFFKPSQHSNDEKMIVEGKLKLYLTQSDQRIPCIVRHSTNVYLPTQDMRSLQTEILIAEVVEPEETNARTLESLKKYSIQEVLLNRNLPVTINEDD